MVTKQSTKIKKRALTKPVPLPDIPERLPDDMTSFQHLSLTGNAHFLMHHLGNREDLIVSGERYICQERGKGMRYPDLLVAFNADPQTYLNSNGYVVSEQGKPPDFVLEIGSKRTAKVDTQVKPRFYADLGVLEYWRFDETGEFHGERLAGGRLAAGDYEPLPIEEVAEGILQGYSPILNLLLRWEQGELKWHDPETREHIATFLGEREARLREREARFQERDGRLRERETRLREREARLAAEARVRELEEQIRRGNND